MNKYENKMIPNISQEKLMKYHWHSLLAEGSSLERRSDANMLYPWSIAAEKTYFEVSIKNIVHGRGFESNFLLTVSYSQLKTYLEG
jgi:hypothetical protein